jgi:dTDP-4-dehydrorhamnose 3,5-epimerase
MHIRETSIQGCFEITPNVFRDERGSFVKTFHHEMFRAHGLETDWREEYYSVSRKGVLRGMHFQLPPHDHAKLVYCPDGTVLDAVVDLRGDSATYGRHVLTELNSEKANMLYITKGLAHGFYVMSESATMMYKVSTVYAPDHDAGILWNSLGIAWPDVAPVMSERDRAFPEFAELTTNPFLNR